MIRTLIVCCEEKIYKYMKDYITSWIGQLNAKLLLVSNLDNCQYNTSNIYLFIQKIPKKLFHSPLNNIYLISTEQITNSEFSDLIKNVIAKNISIIEYSIENIKFINNKYQLANENDILYLPYQYYEDEVKTLKKYIGDTQKTYDVVIVGWLSPTREKIYNELISNGIKVLHLNLIWDDARDKAISSAKILLNIHQSKNHNIYEAFRCDRWAFSGMIVVSESSLYDKLLDINQLVIFEDYDGLKDKIINIINNYDEYYKEFINKYDNNISKIKSNRQNELYIMQEKIINNKLNYTKNNIIEIFSANWVCNYSKDSYIKSKNKVINLDRGFNLFGLKENKLEFINSFDTWYYDFSYEIQKKTKEIIDDCNYDYLIIITHDDATSKVNMTILQNYLIFLDCHELQNLLFRGSYLLIYDIKEKKNIYENYNNKFPIHLWFEMKICNNRLIINNLGMPIYLIGDDLIKNKIDRIKNHKNIHIIVNDEMAIKYEENYYKNNCNAFIHKINSNISKKDMLNNIMWQLPETFAFVDDNIIMESQYFQMYTVFNRNYIIK
ncbi:glycosyltransferase [Indivirus ILV1]|uniref:Glycosyltransferase n=1 Tax=Indivirus ILV1 TaxID=1977633 RepID=A0A1V0SE34_9VIRU|nr:glycosyltransferase [Indivirus ILV1]